MKHAPGVDLVTCLSDLSDLPYLEQLLFSVMGQADPGPLRLHVMLQRFSFTDVRAVRAATAEVRRLHDRTSMTLYNWDYPAPFDLRVPSLNWGLEVAQGRHVMVLDVRDHLRPHACGALLSRLRGTSAALALGGAVLRPVWWWGDVILPAPGRSDEPSLIPVFMMDSSRLALADRVFLDQEGGSATDEFVRRISASHAVDATHGNETLVVRRDPVASPDPHPGS